MQLVVAPDQRYDVELMTDAPPTWTGLKVMCMDAEIQLSVGTTVELVKDGASSVYTVAQALGPAAPRGWRFFLSPAAVPAPAAPQSAPVSVSSSNEISNIEKYYIIKVSALVGNGVRLSSQEIKVSYSSLSAEFQRLTRAGAKILSISEAPRLG
ncbi:MAG: hypothetical protein OHK0012_07870 [Synechococcales cyanobacterium]